MRTFTEEEIFKIKETKKGILKIIRKPLSLEHYRELERRGLMDARMKARVPDGVLAEVELEKKYSDDLKAIEEALNNLGNASI